MDSIEKVAEWLFDLCGEVEAMYVGMDNIITWKERTTFHTRHYTNLARQLLSTLGLTDTQIEALGQEGNRLAVVRDAQELPKCQMEEISENIHMIVGQLYDYYLKGQIVEEFYKKLVTSSGVIQADTEINLYRGAQRDMLDAGYVQEVRD